MKFCFTVLTTTLSAIALGLLGNPLVATAGTLNFNEQPVSEAVPDFTQKIVLFQADSDKLSLLSALSPSETEKSSLFSSLTSSYFFQAMTLAGNWQPETQISVRETPPQWDFKPTGWTTFR